MTDGRITKGGGISSSTDVGLELVKMKLGVGTARAVRRRLEYGRP